MQILALGDPALLEKYKAFKQGLAEKIAGKNAALQAAIREGK